VTLGKQLTQLMPTQPYIILVDTARDHCYIKRDDQVMLHALVSTDRGTIISLSSPDGNPWHWAIQQGAGGDAAHIMT
jgi:L,D-transpeptidase YbiS